VPSLPPFVSDKKADEPLRLQEVRSRIYNITVRVRYNVSVSSWFQHVIVDTGKLRLFCFLVFFILAFLFIRLSVRLIRANVRWWPGNVTPGGTHIHHIVFGLAFMCVGGIGGLAVQDPRSGSRWCCCSTCRISA
jgi:hypothetical protein